MLSKFSGTEMQCSPTLVVCRIFAIAASPLLAMRSRFGRCGFSPAEKTLYRIPPPPRYLPLGPPEPPPLPPCLSKGLAAGPRPSVQSPPWSVGWGSAVCGGSPGLVINATPSLLFPQFLWGDSLLVAPIVSQQDHLRAARTVYLPSARGWIHFWTGELHPPGVTTVPAPLDQVPLFVPQGGIIVLGPFLQYATQYLGLSRQPAMEVRVYPGLCTFLCGCAWAVFVKPCVCLCVCVCVVTVTGRG